MNVQAHLSGQISGQVQNQLQPQQNGNQQMQTLSAPNAPTTGGAAVAGAHPVNLYNVEPDFVRYRMLMQHKIFTIISQRQSQPIGDLQKQKFKEFARRLEEGLFKAAQTKDDYGDESTLEIRLSSLLKRPPANSQNQRHQQLVNSSSSIGTMIPTPGMSNSGNSNMMTSSVDTMMISSSGRDSIAPIPANTGSLLPSSGMHNGSFSRPDGNMSNSYQQSPANFSISSGGNMSSMGVHIMASQMIPTPGLSNNNNSNNQSYMNVESSNNSGVFSTADSAMVSQTQQPKQYIGGQNSRILANLGSQMGSNIRTGLQQKSYGFANGPLNGGMGMMGNNILLVNEPGTSEGYMTSTHYVNSPKPLPQQFDQHQRQLMQGDGYGMRNADSLGSGNIYGAVTSVGSMMNAQSMSKTNSSLVNNQSNLHAPHQAGHIKHQSLDRSEKMNFQSSLQQHPHQQQQLQQHPHQFQQQQSAQLQRLQKQQTQQHQHLLNNDAFGQSLLTSDPSSQVKREPGLEHHNDVLHSQTSDHLQISELQNQFQQNVVGEHSRNVQNLSHSDRQHDMCSSLTQNSQQMQQMLHPHQLVSESQNNFNGLSVGTQSDSALQGQWYPQSQDQTRMPGSMSHEQHVQEDFLQRISGQGEAQRNNLASEGSIVSQTLPPRSTSEPQNSNGVTYRSGKTNRDRQFRNQQKWLLFLRHARRCPAPEGQCPDPNCTTVQKLLRHMDRCNSTPCSYPRCQHTRILIHHFKHCRDAGCPVCIPVRNYLEAQIKIQMKACTLSASDPGLPSKGSDTGDNAAQLISRTPSIVESSENQQPPLKRMKIEQSSQTLKPESEVSDILAPAVSDVHITQDVQHQDHKHGDNCPPVKSECMEVKLEVPASSRQGSPSNSEIKKDDVDDVSIQMPADESMVHVESANTAKQENIKVDKEAHLHKQENATHPAENATHPAENAAGTKSGKPKIKGVSLTELFTPEQVREHIIGLRQWVGQSKSKAEKNQAMEHSMSENSCQLCAVEKLTFEPPPIYCTPCGARIKRNAMYYTMGAGDARQFFCIPCYNEARGDTIVADGTAILKARLEKKRNDEETEEWWVQCDKCEAWQHQICALFNGRRNDGGQAEYTCPNCYITEVERGERKPLPQSAVLGAKDLPRTILSDHIEQRLFRRLKLERQDRAREQGKSFDDVPGAESLVVRVVSSVDKKLEVKQRFLEIFREENYPTEFPYKSKVVLLFQKIEGVEVCLFGMYVQEFGSEAHFPNQRRVYLSYLDSVKYFRPEIKTVNGEALRTFVYHEILIGYLDYCKKRGFTSCYIWACPPLKGEDYILYCHPEIQKTPKSDKLREWYLVMLRKAAKENVVADLTNLYDHFFLSTGECKAKVTAARLPYFDGDYWPGAAEDLIYQLNQEEDGRKQNKKGSTKKTITKRALKASGQTDLSGNASKDLLLMHKLGETISPMKEDFIMVHLQPCCSHCCILMVSGTHWVCNQCKNFKICDKCYEVEQKREERERHPINQREKHAFYPVEITDVPADTKDKDEILESEFFDTRQAFLSLCQGNHYQYDTLRRAKHSSMMVLYHLHNPTAPAFVTTCNKCHLDIETGQGWRCEVCPDYDVCNSCYQKYGGMDHPHKLTNHPSLAERDAQNKEARQVRVQQLRKMLDLLVHASQCRSPNCQYPNCRKVKGLFRHGIHCKTRASGGCVLCKKMWYLLQLHARACKESECHVPRCRDLKEHLRRLQQQSDSRRRAAVMEMMRQRAAEVAGNSG